MAAPDAPQPITPRRRLRSQRDEWWLRLFAGTLMIITGLFNALEGLVALFNDEVYAVGLRYVFAFDLTTRGWFHLLVGIAVAGQASR